MYCLNDQTSHVKSNPTLTGVKIFYPYETDIPLQSICEVMILIGGRDYYPYGYKAYVDGSKHICT